MCHQFLSESLGLIILCFVLADFVQGVSNACNSSTHKYGRTKQTKTDRAERSRHSYPCQSATEQSPSDQHGYPACHYGPSPRGHS